MEQNELKYNLDVYKEIKSLYPMFRDPIAFLVAKLDSSTKKKLVETIKMIKSEHVGYSNMVDFLEQECMHDDDDDDEEEMFVGDE